MRNGTDSHQLIKEYKSIRENPPPYITAHPSEDNLLEWHYVLTGPPDTPYHNGQYWGTLRFPPDYPFKPPSIQMHTPSGRFQPSTRLCLSISDFHPKSFNPAWEVSTILIGLLSFMTGDEMTTGSVSASEAERVLLAKRTRWWNSTLGGRRTSEEAEGGKFKKEWEELDKENWKWMREEGIDPRTGNKLGGRGTVVEKAAEIGSGLAVSGVNGAVIAQRNRGGGISKAWYCLGLVVAYVLIARMLE